MKFATPWVCALGFGESIDGDRRQGDYAERFLLLVGHGMGDMQTVCPTTMELIARFVCH